MNWVVNAEGVNSGQLAPDRLGVQTLGIELELVLKDVATRIQATLDRAYFSGSDWSDASYDRMLAEAGSLVDRSRRLQQLGQCEHHLLRCMPIVPLSAGVWPSLAKPYIRGLSSNHLNRQPFKYVRIDTTWRPS